ncbi:hypothetical protein MML48_8g00016395 [Holotrichia oblita]|uniref:Uncharacterized protein n=1 Tax=Holotrichia oblita TaxID=644536 RepID=A0ACB9SP75_HOLOL|nr:hypothetical protein MML48_8g00016395 [Holotrichia oblita]
MHCISIKVLLFLGSTFSVLDAISYGYNRGDSRENNGGYHGGRSNKKEQKYYQDIYIAQLFPKELEFGHVKETPFSWEQRFEKINLDDNRHQGKAKWNDPKSGYGEFYYDFNHSNDEENSKDDEEKEDGKKQSLHDILSDGRNLLEKGEVEFIDGKSFDTLANGQNGQSYHGGNYKAAPNSGNQRNSISGDKYKSKY